MAWVYLVIAGTFEVVWAVAMKFSEGFTRLLPSIVTLLGAWVSFAFLSRATATIPLGTAYAVWTGIGAVGAVIAGILVFKEPAGAWRLTFAGLILLGIIGLKLTS